MIRFKDLKKFLTHQNWTKQANRRKRGAFEKAQEKKTHMFAHSGIL